MKQKKYTLHSTNLKDFYVPLNEIRVELYKVRANNSEDAINKLVTNPSKGTKVRSIQLSETMPNCVFTDQNINEHELLNKQIDHYQIHDKEMKNFPMKLIK